MNGMTSTCRDRLRTAAASLALAAVSVWLSPAWAARPMITDDARLVDAGACQVESWFRHNRSDREAWALPGCNPTGNLELTLGGALGDAAGRWQTSNLVAQAKTLVVPLAGNPWGIGVAGGVVRRFATEPGATRVHDVYAYVPLSVAWNDEAQVLHANLGWRRDGALGAHRFTWGSGLEARLSTNAFLVAELFGENRGKPSYQAGMRFWVIRDRLQIDSTIGNEVGHRSDRRWFSIGMRILSPAFLQ